MNDTVTLSTEFLEAEIASIAKATLESVQKISFLLPEDSDTRPLKECLETLANGSISQLGFQHHKADALIRSAIDAAQFHAACVVSYACVTTQNVITAHRTRGHAISRCGPEGTRIPTSLGFLQTAQQLCWLAHDHAESALRVADQDENAAYE